MEINQLHLKRQYFLSLNRTEGKRSQGRSHLGGGKGAMEEKMAGLMGMASEGLQ